LKKIAILTSHPIQYNAPFFRALSSEPEIDLMVFYTWGKEGAKSKFDPDFNQQIEWDIPLLEDYAYQFCENTSKHPGSHHFQGIKNPSLINQLNELNPDIIWVWGWAFHSHLSVLRQFKGKTKIWFRGDSTLLDEKRGFAIKKILRQVFLKWVYSHVDKVFYVGSNNKNYYLKFGLKSSQLIYAPHAIDNSRFFKIKRTVPTKDNFRLLFVGKLEPRKNPFFLKDIISSLQGQCIELFIVGSGPLEPILKDELKNYSNVHFLGFKNQNEMPQLYANADLLILPSVSETWGLAINESLASGTPVAASIYCGGAIDLINENNGFIFDPELGLSEFLVKFNAFRKREKHEFVAEFDKRFNHKYIVKAVLENLS
jgi:glycosyltransferase involved in cell wall biosynthesis